MNFKISSCFIKRALWRSKLGLQHKRRAFYFILCIGLFVTIILLHFVLLPSFTGAYNNDCYLSEAKLKDLRYLILTSAKLMEKYNRTYWLDFGTLLGAVKFGDVLPWDGDADISFIYHKEFHASKMNEEFGTYSIDRNGLVAVYNNSQLDYGRWNVMDGMFNGIQQKVLEVYYPKWITDTDNIFVKFEHSRETVPLSWVVPTTKIDFAGISVAVPREYKKILKARYPLTYPLNIFTPYKWKCWLPCWLTGDKTCKKYLAKLKGKKV